MPNGYGLPYCTNAGLLARADADFVPRVYGLLTVRMGACHYLTNFRWLREGSAKQQWWRHGSAKQPWWRRGGSVDIVLHNLSSKPNPKIETTHGWAEGITDLL